MTEKTKDLHSRKEIGTPYVSLLSAIQSVYGNGIKVRDARRLSGGDINDAFCLTLNDGQRVFCKCNRKENLSFFTTEAEGLHAIRATKVISVPDVLALGTDDGLKMPDGFRLAGGAFSFLLLSYVESAPRNKDYWERFGHALAAMHKAPTEIYTNGKQFGFTMDNYIGAGAQRNDGRNSWVEFFRDLRLRPQMERAAHYFSPDIRKRADRLLERLEDYLTEPAYPSLLHGDLWGGNVMTGSDGEAWLIDPAAYVGHAEADLAMTQLFGSFDSKFYAAYEEAAPLTPGFSDRRDLYNLYHLLNHLNLFGTGYLGSVEAVIRKYA